MSKKPSPTDHGDLFDWTVLKALQEANAASMIAMEEYLLHAIGPDDLGNAADTRILLQRSITHHERILEHLQLAARQVANDTDHD